MARTCMKPTKFNHYCVFCENWTGDAGMTFRSVGAGYEFERETAGKCIRTGGTTRATSGCKERYEPNREAQKLM